jgi:hypothetical protein
MLDQWMRRGKGSERGVAGGEETASGPGSAARSVHLRINPCRKVAVVRSQHHYIFFRELSQGILGVISILHENMDIPSRLKEDSKPLPANSHFREVKSWCDSPFSVVASTP